MMATPLVYVDGFGERVEAYRMDDGSIELMACVENETTIRCTIKLSSDALRTIYRAQLSGREAWLQAQQDRADSPW